MLREPQIIVRAEIDARRWTQGAIEARVAHGGQALGDSYIKRSILGSNRGAGRLIFFVVAFFFFNFFWFKIRHGRMFLRARATPLRRVAQGLTACPACPVIFDRRRPPGWVW